MHVQHGRWARKAVWHRGCEAKGRPPWAVGIPPWSWRPVANAQRSCLQSRVERASCNQRALDHSADAFVESMLTANAVGSDGSEGTIGKVL